MCEACGCSLKAEPDPVHHRENLAVHRRLLAQNDHEARHNRLHFDEYGVLAINLMSAPGSGKTSLLEATIDRLRSRHRICVIEGDLETDNDARRIRAHGVPAFQINTGNACHLDASMLHHALHEIRLADVDLLFIENVGNLVCPASFDLDQHRNVVLLSVPEGDDKPAKYPVMFRAADLVLITKTDLLPHLTEFSVPRAEASLRSIANAAPVLKLSSRSSDDLDGWCDWLIGEKRALDERRAKIGHVAHEAHGEHVHAHAPAG